MSAWFNVEIGELMAWLDDEIGISVSSLLRKYLDLSLDGSSCKLRMACNNGATQWKECACHWDQDTPHILRTGYSKAR